MKESLLNMIIKVHKNIYKVKSVDKKMTSHKQDIANCLDKIEKINNIIKEKKFELDILVTRYEKSNAEHHTYLLTLKKEYEDATEEDKNKLPLKYHNEIREYINLRPLEEEVVEEEVIENPQNL